MTERYSRIDIYDYVYNLFYDVVTKNVYSMFEPQELTTSDTNDGFLVIRVGDLYDESEFTCSAYGWARVYVEAYVPPLSRGRLDYTKYQEYEDAITEHKRKIWDDATMSYDEKNSIVNSMEKSLSDFRQRGL